MLTYPSINLVAIQIGPIKIYWYGVMYLISFLLAWVLAKIHAKNLNYNWNNETISDFIFYCAVGAVLGGRVGYVLFYEFGHFLYEPLFIFKTWMGGMSFHGGLIGLILGLFFFSRKVNKSFVELMDFTAPLAPLGLGLGRIGNFINHELIGRPSSLPWSIISVDDLIPRHPSQLYEAFFEGVVLFAVLWIYSRKPRPVGRISAIFLISYGIIRFSCEFFRQPEITFGWLTMGQLLCIPMIMVGIIMLILQKKMS